MFWSFLSKLTFWVTKNDQFFGKVTFFHFCQKWRFWHFWKRNVYFSALNVQISHFLGRGGRVATRQVGFLEGVIFGVRFWLDFWSTFFSIFDQPQISVERWFFTFLDFRGPIFDITFWAISRSKMSHFLDPLEKFKFLTLHGSDFLGPPNITFFQLFYANMFFIKIVLFLWSNSHPVFDKKWSF